MTPTLLFDLDGTLVETDHLHFQAFKSVFAPYGVTLDWEAYRKRIMGGANAAIAASFLPHVAVDRHAAIMDLKEQTYRDLVGDVEGAAGLTALLDWAADAGIACGVVTNAPRANADMILKALGLENRFGVLVIGSEIADAKPHPLPYLTALKALGGDAAVSVAFEDSPAGATAAVAAGLGVVGLLTSADPGDLLGVGVHVVGRDFDDPAVLDFIRARTGADGRGHQGAAA